VSFPLSSFSNREEGEEVERFLENAKFRLWKSLKLIKVVIPSGISHHCFWRFR
jgi:hypothetical protein